MYPRHDTGTMHMPNSHCSPGQGAAGTTFDTLGTRDFTFQTRFQAMQLCGMKDMLACRDHRLIQASSIFSGAVVSLTELLEWRKVMTRRGVSCTSCLQTKEEYDRSHLPFYQTHGDPVDCIGGW